MVSFNKILDPGSPALSGAEMTTVTPECTEVGAIDLSFRPLACSQAFTGEPSPKPGSHSFIAEIPICITGIYGKPSLF